MIRFPNKWNTDNVFDQAAYYARRQGEFKDVMSKLEEMARLGAKVGNAMGMVTVQTQNLSAGSTQRGQLRNVPSDGHSEQHWICSRSRSRPWDSAVQVALWHT